MKRTAILLLATALAVPAMAAEESPRRDMSGRTGLVFDFNGLNLSGFEGGVGVKTWLSKSLALVGGLEYDHSRTSADTAPSVSGYQTTSSDFGVFIAFEHHLKVSKTVSPYWGLSLSFGGYELDSKYLPAPDYGGLPTDSGGSNLYIEPRVFLGVEFFLGDHVSFSGCYRLGLNYQWGTNHTEIANSNDQTMTVMEQKTSRTTWALGSSSLRLTIYF
jgi:hypothetical protein